MAEENGIPETTPSEIDQAIQQVRESALDPRTKDLIERLLRTYLRMVSLLRQKNMTARKFRDMIFGPKTEKLRGRKASREKKAREEAAGKAEDAAPAGEEPTASAEAEKKAVKGHGRRSASAYAGARKVQCRHPEYQAGDQCPHALCGGRLYDTKDPNGHLQFTGQPMIVVTRYEREALRCSACQDRFVAPLPEGVTEERYDATADATIALMKYGAGLPFYRQSRLQEMTGVPLSESVLWERCEATANAALGVYLELNQLVANSEVLHSDDTRVKILSCVKEKEESGEDLKTTCATGIVAKVGERKIALYFSDRRQTGETVKNLLKQRAEDLGRPIQMSDALPANWSEDQDVIKAKCLAHGRRQVYELRDWYPAQCKVVLEAVGKVYRHDEATVGMSPEERLAWHRRHSGPVMSELKEWIEAQFRERLAEPNGSLGKALKYWLRHWEDLTAFLRVPGAPLDNNAAEQALKRLVLWRKNSLFYKTENGAAIGDLLMSLIETCHQNKINAWDYLVTLIRNRTEARRNPKRFLPWNYKDEEALAA